MALVMFQALQFNSCNVFGTRIIYRSKFLSKHTNVHLKPMKIEARNNTRTESPKIRNRRMRKKFNGTPTRPRLSVFCSDKQLYAMLVDDHNKKNLFYGSTLQKAMREDPTCSTVEAAKRVGEELVKACIDLNINEISSYDLNGFVRGAKIEAFEIAISRHGFLPEEVCI